MKRTLSILALTLSAVAAHAAVTITAGNIAPVLDKNGQPVAAGSRGVLVADFSNNGIVLADNTQLSVGSFIGAGVDDRILGVFAASDLSGSGDFGFDFSGVSWSYSGNFGAGDHLYFMWFPEVFTSDSVLSQGTSYGVFRSDIKDVSADIAWVAAPDGQNVALVSLGGALGGDPGVSAAQLTASLATTAIPEPSSFAAFAGLAVLGAVASRRRRSV
jgi:MYXO-CTERM domain-containing protein